MYAYEKINFASLIAARSLLPIQRLFSDQESWTLFQEAEAGGGDSGGLGVVFG